MIEIMAKLSSKHQVTIPAEIRRTLGVGARDRIAFVVDDEGAVAIRPPKYTIRSLAGSVPALPGASADLRKEIEEATEVEIDRKMSKRALNDPS